MKKELRYIFAHKFFNDLNFMLFELFGTLILFYKSQSVTLTLLSVIIAKIPILLARTVFLRPFLRAHNFIGVKKVLFIGLIGMFLGSLMLFSIQEGMAWFVFWFFLAHIVQSFGSMLYHLNINKMILVQIGKSGQTEQISALRTNLKLVAAIIISVLGFTFRSDALFNYLLLFGAVNIIISFFFLAKLKEGIHEKYDFRFKDIFRNISLGAFLANISIEGNLRKRVFPIYLTLIFVSLETPIVIASAAGLVSILLNHVAAHFKSRNQNGLIYVTIFLKLIFWVAISLGISHAGASVIIATLVVYDICRHILSTVQESNYAKEAVQADSSFETNFAIEFARHTGIALAPAIALGFYLLTNTLPETMFLIAIPFMIPGAMYALKKVGSK